jgi:hypothetical protein
VIRWAKRSALTAIGAVLSIEIVLRTIAAFPADTACFVRRPDGSLRYHAHASCGPAAINARGFPDVDHPDRKAPGVRRVALVGDSFVVGPIEPDANMFGLIRRHAAEAGPLSETINLGISNTGPHEYLDVMRTDAASLDIDITVVLFDVGTDVLQSHPDFRTSVWLGSAHETLRRPFLIGASPAYSYAFRLMRSLSRAFADWRHPEPDGTFSRTTYLSIERQRLEICARQPSRFVRDSYAGLDAIIASMADETRRHGGRLIGVIAPDEFQVSDRIRDDLAAQYALTMSEYDLAMPQRLIAQVLADHGVPALDLLPALREAETEGEVYLKYNTHWSPLGNRIAADAIWRVLAGL